MTDATESSGSDRRAEFDQVADNLLSRLDFSSPEANESTLLTLSSIMSLTEKLMDEREGLHEEFGSDVEMGILSLSTGADEIREHIEGSGVAASVEYTRDHAKIVLYDVTVEDVDRLIDANLQYVRSAIGE